MFSRSIILYPLRGGCSATQEDELGQLYLSNVDFLKNGVPASIIATLVRHFSELDGWILQ